MERKECTALLAIPTPQRKVLITDEWLDEVRRRLPRLEVVDTEKLDTQAWHRLLDRKQPEILLTGWGTPMLPEVPPENLEYIGNLTGSIRPFLPRSYLEKGVRVTNWGDSISRTIAEMALYLILNGLRRGPAFHENLHHRKAWKEGVPTTKSLFNRNVGIHGFGRIARELVGLLRPFDVSVSAYSPPVPDLLFQKYNTRRTASLDALFSENEIIVELEGLTPQTQGMVKAKHLKQIPDGGLFVNVGRAGLVEEEALVSEARAGRISFGLDVFWEEPLPEDSPLRGLPNVALFPHVAGATPDHYYRFRQRALDNLLRYLNGEALIEPLDLESYDRIT